jgi:Family of unknown function (DUF6191)
MLRDDQGDGAPPRTRVDLDGGRAIVRLPEHRTAPPEQLIPRQPGAVGP